MGQLTVVAEGRLAGDWTAKTAGTKTLRTARLAVNERAKKAGEWVDVATHWFTLQDWDGHAAGGKGDIVEATGRWQSHEWTTRDGEVRKDVQLNLTGPVRVVRGTSGAVAQAAQPEADDLPLW